MTEYQALEALLVPSADNIADRLADWDAGSVGAFVAKMNAMARAFGLSSTRYVDASGVDPGSSSTAADQAFVASRLMENAVPRSIVRRPRINLPVVGIIPNRNPALRVDGIVGVKGGYSSHAHDCLVTAAYRLHHAALVVSVALGQPDPLSAARIDEALLQSATRVLYEHRLLAVSGRSVPQFGFRLERARGARFLTAVVWPSFVLREVSAAGRITLSAPWSTIGPFRQAGKK
jgi:D-alanyl-D-alanine carboxypeptidase (penicillin-binding protein 5/6)